MSVVFICGSHRSGTTSLLRALQLSCEAFGAVEPAPNLNVESRQLFDQLLYDPFDAISRHIAPRVARGLARRRYYIEKQNSLVPFIPFLWRYFGCRFVVPVRDGRDVVTSLINWHSQMYPIIYQECREPCEYSEHAREVLARQTGIDEFDYSLPRPGRDDPWREDWPRFSRFEMVAWYWNFINLYLARILEEIPRDRYIVVDYTKPTVDTVRRVYEFIGLEDFDPDSVATVLGQKVNSLTDRGAGAGLLPRWPSWSAARSQRFRELAWEAFTALGYANGSRPAPPLVAQVEPPAPVEIESPILEVAGATSAVSVDATHNSARSGEKADLAACTYALDSTHDIDALVDRTCEQAGRAIYLRSKGYWGRLALHRHDWDPESGRCQTRVSPKALEARLRANGFPSVAIFPARPAAAGPADTVAIATRMALDPTRLVSQSMVFLDYAPYRAEEMPATAREIRDLVNASCSYLSNPSLGLINSMSFFAAVVADLTALKRRRLGTVRQLAGCAAGVNTAIRIDVDSDIVAAVEMARVLERRGAPGSFYLLHTAPYHGRFAGGRFLRNRGAADLYRDIARCGAEVGMHVDPYLLYRDLGLDGASGVATELAWLRASGLDITGVTGHNCASVYGAESVEIFADWQVRPGSVFQKDFVYAPLGVLDARALGLEYEGGGLHPDLGDRSPAGIDFVNVQPRGDFIRDPRWLRKYLLENGYCRWGYDFNVWVLGSDQWALAGSPGGHPRFEFGIPWARVLQLLDELPETARVALTLHPCYFGERTSATASPAAAI